jgi:FAD/FMN-containing dehydrogenase
MKDVPATRSQGIARKPAQLTASELASANDLTKVLRERLQGEVRFDAGSRALYATDLSIYRQPPIGVVIPQSLEDVIITVEECRKRGLPILGRGCGRASRANAAMWPW